jgi:RNA polymerase sigma-70 factor (ECF subfamily)
MVASYRAMASLPKDIHVEESPPESQTDAWLMRALAGGDTNALAVLVRRHQPAVLSTAYRLLGRWDQAEDVAQEAFIRVYRAASGYTPSAAFTTWLYRIVVNLCQDALRKRRPTVETPDDLSNRRSTRPDHAMEQDERVQAVRRAIGGLPERQRIAVILHRYSGMSHAQISEATGWTPSAVESCLVRAYARLRDELAHLQA